MYFLNMLQPKLTCKKAIHLLNYTKQEIVKEKNKLKSDTEHKMENSARIQFLASLYANCTTAIQELEELEAYSMEQIQKERGKKDFLL